jgi:pimeloyl-ACP methyl ester carboxylesterase
MGGRLALHLATRAPQSVAAIVAISAHPGLHDVAEITSRRRWEAEWAQRFLTETWASVVQAWDQQLIFSTSQTPVRATSLQKELVALSLSRWSPTSHLFSWAQLLNSACPVHQIVGQKDAKYLNLMQQLNPDSQRFSVVENAGHRVLVDQPESLAQIIKAYLTAHVREVAIEKDVS